MPVQARPIPPTERRRACDPQPRTPRPPAQIDGPRCSCNSVITPLAAGLHRRGRNLQPAHRTPRPAAPVVRSLGLAARSRGGSPRSPSLVTPIRVLCGLRRPPRGPAGKQTRSSGMGPAGPAGPWGLGTSRRPGQAWPVHRPTRLGSEGLARPSLAWPQRRRRPFFRRPPRPAPLDSRSEEAMTVMTSWGHHSHGPRAGLPVPFPWRPRSLFTRRAQGASPRP